jgi:hypothetical protein
MLYVVLIDGTLEELPDATQTVAEDGTLACLDAQGNMVKRYERNVVGMFSHDDKAKRIADMMRRADGNRLTP